MYSLPGTLQPISNQVVGTVIAAILKRQVYQRAATPSLPGSYTPEKFYLNYMNPMVAVSTVTQEAYEAHAEVTQHPVEDGSVFSDHVILRPLRFEMTFEVSNYDGFGTEAISAKQTLDNMLKVWRARQLFSLLTTHRLLENVVCLSISATNDAPEWGRLSFRATFQEIRLVPLQSQTFPRDRVQGVSATVSSGTGQVDLLPQPSGPATPKSAQSAAKPIQKTVKLVNSQKGVFDKALGVSWGGR